MKQILIKRLYLLKLRIIIINYFQILNMKLNHYLIR